MGFPITFISWIPHHVPIWVVPSRRQGLVVLPTDGCFRSLLCPAPLLGRLRLQRQVAAHAASDACAWCQALADDHSASVDSRLDAAALHEIDRVSRAHAADVGHVGLSHDGSLHQREPVAGGTVIDGSPDRVATLEVSLPSVDEVEAQVVEHEVGCVEVSLLHPR